MKRISKIAKGIADAHIEARQGVRAFDEMPEGITTREQVIALLLEGKVLEPVIKQVEARFSSVGSAVLNGVFGYASNNYRASVYKGFKILIDNN
jgi:hypothetical protein